MAREPRDRHASMAELEADLRELDPSVGLEPEQRASQAPSAPQLGTQPVTTTRPRAATIQAQRIEREVRAARPTLVLLTLVGYGWVVVTVVVALADGLRFMRGSQGRLTPSEGLLIGIGTFVATLTPAVLWIVHLRRRVWSNTVTSVEFSRRLRRSLLAGVIAQASLGLLVDLVEGTVLRLPMGQLRAACSTPVVLTSLALTALTFCALGRRTNRK